MHSNSLFQAQTEVLSAFQQITKLGVYKNTPSKMKDWNILNRGDLNFFYILDGKFEWFINGTLCVLLPHDVLVLKMDDLVHNNNDLLEVGTIIELGISEIEGKLFHEKWSGINITEGLLIHQFLEQKKPMIIPNLKEGAALLQRMIKELTKNEIGYISRVNGLIDEFFVIAARALSLENKQSHDFPSIFLKLDKMLRENLSHPWTVNEMGSLVGLGTTAFTEKIKFYTGFAPLQYLINLRLAEAMRMIKNTDHSLTTIALELGFYSSQHFSSTFKKLTGFSPKSYRKNGF
jgi:AraC family transcriptional regulator, activator of mtrCDE